MDTGRTLLSCPGRVQDWLGAAVDQIESLLQAPMPSLSGSDLAIGAARAKLERPSWTTGPYSSCPTNPISSAFTTTYQIPPSVSFDRPLCEEKSSSRCENCVAEKGSRCSRSLPSCTRCHKKGLLCFYTGDVPTGRRKPQGRIRSHIREGEPVLPLESFSAVSASEDLAVLEIRSFSEEYPTIPPVGSLMGTSSAGDSTSSQCRAVVAKREVATFPPAPIPSNLPCGTSKQKTICEISRVESESQWPGAVADGPNPSLVRGTDPVATVNPCQNPGSEEERKTLENALREYAENEIQKHTAHFVAPPLQPRTSFYRQTSVVSSLATTPFASTLASRSTSRSSGTDSLPITPANELPASPTNNDARTCLLHMEQHVDLYLRSHHRHQIALRPTPGAGPQEKSFPDGFIEELFEEGDAAKGLAELQQRSPKKRKFSSGP